MINSVTFLLRKIGTDIILSVELSLNLNRPEMPGGLIKSCLNVRLFCLPSDRSPWLYHLVG